MHPAAPLVKAVISPLWANLCLHHVLDNWVKAWRKNHKTGYFMVYRKTIGRRIAAERPSQKLRRRLHESTENTKRWLEAVVRGYFQYQAVPRNDQRLNAFRSEVLRMWLWQLRRSQRSRWTWEKFKEKLGNQLPKVAIPHPYPEVRFALKHPNFGKNIRGRNRVR